MTTINYTYFPDLLGDVVSKMNTYIQNDSDLTALSGVSVIYEYGTLIELQKRIKIKDLRSSQKYPLIWLVWERPDNKKQFRGAFLNRTYKVSPLIFIIGKTNPDYSSTDRNTNIFKPILMPIYNKLLFAIAGHRNFNTGNFIEHDEYEHYFWGMDDNGKTILSDFNDAIELKLLDIEVVKKC
jgi:hypothetical protein